MRALNIDALTQLSSIRFGLSFSPAVIDLSHSTILEEIDVSDLKEFERLILPEENIVSIIDVSGPNQLSTVNVEYIISNVHRNAVLHSTVNGVFTYLKTLIIRRVMIHL